MSAVMNFAIFPLDNSTSVGDYVAEVVAMIRESGYAYQFTPMSTCVEAEKVEELTILINKSFALMSKHSSRIYCTVSIDLNTNKTGRIAGKKKSIEDRIGKV